MLTIATLYFNRITEKKMTFSEVPRLLKDKVAELLRENGKEEFIKS